ncbi:hypothetical protein [Luteolibacter luteus]|uniref:AsmA-like C-terminal domain-containing protein n=1 Tax=Luteolibacter luteus TaxID=2728835 RepID=A0A858RD68_9BACT|nr:hypothetical protein [Luteolibacter luteus]QJE94672.1 hypothetical protein HHL09_02380 [Luteolibacter luteus]
MADSDSEPDNYSIDEMMDRLRSRGEGGQDGDAPQLVTRPDGTQVYRVKKRKRRSRQPKKEKEARQKRFRILQVILAVALVILVAVCFFASLVFLNSSAYRDSVIAKIQAWSGAETKVTQLRLTPVGASADAIEFTWPQESILAKLDLRGLQGDLNFTKLVGGSWHGSEIVAGQGGNLLLRPPTGNQAWFKRPEGELPFHFRYRSPKFNVLLGEETAPAFHVRNSEASLEIHEPEAVSASLRLDGGTATFAGWGDFKLEFASLLIEKGKIFLSNARLSPVGAAKGRIEISNNEENKESVPFDFESGETILPVRVADIELQHLLGPSFGSFLSTTVEVPGEKATGDLIVRTSGDAGLSWRIPFRAIAAADSTATGLPMFELIARELGEVWYEKPRFDLEAKGVAVRDKNRTGVESLILDARGRISIGGSIFADASGKLDGELQVGLPSSAVDGGSPAFQRVFHRRAGGSSWAKIHISGTNQQPLDDLEVQLKTSSTVTSPAVGGDKALDETFEQLITPGAR